MITVHEDDENALSHSADVAGHESVNVSSGWMSHVQEYDDILQEPERISLSGRVNAVSRAGRRVSPRFTIALKDVNKVRVCDSPLFGCYRASRVINTCRPTSEIRKMSYLFHFERLLKRHVSNIALHITRLEI